MTDLSNVTRVEVIDGYGRSYTSYNADRVHISVQDDGKTLKIFHTGDTSHSATPEHVRSLGELIQVDLEKIDCLEKIDWKAHAELSQQISNDTFHAQAEAVNDDEI